MGVWSQIFFGLLKIFCGGDQKQHGGQQQHGQQQQGGWNQGGQQQGGWNQNQQQQYPPQGWNQGGHQQQQQGGWTGGAISSQHDYTQLRNQARHEGDLAHKCFADSQAAYKSGNGARAKELSNQGKAHQAKQDQMDDQAAAWIFQDNNSRQPPGTIDLHGLYVKEAIEEVDKAIAAGQRNGLQELRVITGKGIHSQNHQAKIKPAVADLMRKYNLSAEVDRHNTGVMVVDLTGRTGGNRSRDAGGLVDQMGGDKECSIM